MTTDRPMGIEVTQSDQELAARLCFGMSEKAIAQAATLIARHRQSSIASPTYAEGRAEVDYWNSVAVGLGHESVCEALEALERLQSPPLTDAPDADRIATSICQSVAEIPDRSSPDDQPDIMLVTADELHTIVTCALENDLTTPPAKDDAGRLREALQDIAEAEAIPNDAAAFIWCRDVARAILSHPQPSNFHKAQNAPEPTSLAENAKKFRSTKRGSRQRVQPVPPASEDGCDRRGIRPKRCNEANGPNAGRKVHGER